MMVWSLFEAKCFKGFFKFNKLDDFGKINVNKLEEFDIDDQIKYFFDRYQDKKKWRNLLYKSSAPDYEKILRKKFEVVTNSEKISFIILVVSRFRNNIFHGSKGLISWLKFKEQINKCSIIMMNILDILKDENC